LARQGGRGKNEKKKKRKNAAWRPFRTVRDLRGPTSLRATKGKKRAMTSLAGAGFGKTQRGKEREKRGGAFFGFVPAASAQVNKGEGKKKKRRGEFFPFFFPSFLSMFGRGGGEKKKKKRGGERRSGLLDTRGVSPGERGGKREGRRIRWLPTAYTFRHYRVFFFVWEPEAKKGGKKEGRKKEGDENRPVLLLRPHPSISAPRGGKREYQREGREKERVRANFHVFFGAKTEKRGKEPLSP